MGQNVFIPHSGGGGAGGAGTSFLTDLLSNAGANYVDYGFAFPGGGGDAFYPTGDFSVIAAFRVVQENLIGELIPVLRLEDGAGKGWTVFISGANKVCASVDAQTLTPDVCDIPLGRVFIVTLTHAAAGDTSLYINGRFLVNTNVIQPAATQPVSFLVGSSGQVSHDYIEYVGFTFASIALNDDEVAQSYMASMDAGRVVMPLAIVGANLYVTFNADVGLTPATTWVPEFNTLAAPSLPAIPNGIATGTVITAPFHVAHSGWADVPPN